MTRQGPKFLNLALQGGGSHGAFTWGVLDRLLEQPRLQFEGVSGTSSGAMNAVVLANGLARGGREAAREDLSRFWSEIADEVPAGFLQPHPLAALNGDVGVDAFPALRAYLELAQHLSPYQMNPTGLNPIRGVLTRLIDFGRLRDSRALRVFISATHVRTGKVRIFDNAELSVEALLASACLPSLHHAVEVEGEAYWDGGFSGNPPVFPLIFNCLHADILVVMLQPVHSGDLPASAEAIQRRQMEISFNSAFLREMRAIAVCKEQISSGWFPSGRLEARLEKLKIHIVEAQQLMEELDAGSRYNALPSFLQMLKEEGRAHADAWLHDNYGNIGQRSNVDLVGVFC
jgi:NTE family protein